MIATEYQVRRAPRHETLRVRGLDMHLTRWGPSPSAGVPPVLLLHGWQDTGDTFQFMVDAFEQDWPLAAPDWRGFGRSEWAQGGYWFPDYLADLDALLEQLSPGVPARIVGHSMGGNVAALVCGAAAAARAMPRQSGRIRAAANPAGPSARQPAQVVGPGEGRTAPQGLRVLRAAGVHHPLPLSALQRSTIGFRRQSLGEARSGWPRAFARGRAPSLGQPRAVPARGDAEACWRAITGAHADAARRAVRYSSSASAPMAPRRRFARSSPVSRSPTSQVRDTCCTSKSRIWSPRGSRIS